MHVIIPKNWTATISTTTTNNNTNVENNNDATNNNATKTTKDWKNETYYQAINIYIYIWFEITSLFPVSQLTPNMYIARARCEAISAVGRVGWMLADHGNRLLCSILLVDPRLLSRFVSRHSICWS